MRVGILGSRGIPNDYGGFEQFAQYLSLGLAAKGCEVSVYNSHNHRYKKSKWNEINIIHRYDPEYLVGQAGQFIYDLNCILDSRKRGFDIILQLGYTTSSIWGRLHHPKAKVLYNMDGIEWKRSKYNRIVQSFLKYAEKLGVKYSAELIADNIVIQEYFQEKYRRKASYIPYGAGIFDNPNQEILTGYNLEPYRYNLIIARFQPDNNTDMLLSGVENSTNENPILVIGKYSNSYGKYLKNRFTDRRIRFLGGIYDITALSNLRFFSSIYFHGHSAGGTNPSLLEAMASSCLICAYDCSFNKAVLGTNSMYFKSSDDVTEILNRDVKKSDHDSFITNNIEVIRNQYSWDKVIDDYYQCFRQALRLRNSD
ncbi:MAG: glycosyltransferase family 1 protein [candidate division Zixibacteria bacterium]|nr:glycosyltransferase family 1 protein [candidate division Zixibacteria bacterium]